MPWAQLYIWVESSETPVSVKIGCVGSLSVQEGRSQHMEHHATYLNAINTWYSNFPGEWECSGRRDVYRVEPRSVLRRLDSVLRLPELLVSHLSCQSNENLYVSPLCGGDGLVQLDAGRSGDDIFVPGWIIFSSEGVLLALSLVLEAQDRKSVV